MTNCRQTVRHCPAHCALHNVSCILRPVTIKSGVQPFAPPSSNWAEVLWNKGSTAKVRSNFFTFRFSTLASRVAEGSATWSAPAPLFRLGPDSESTSSPPSVSPTAFAPEQASSKAYPCMLVSKVADRLLCCLTLAILKKGSLHVQMVWRYSHSYTQPRLNASTSGNLKP